MGPVEEWRAVVGYEGLYEVSSLGRVRSLDRLREQLIARGPDRTRTVSRRLRGRVLAPLPIKSGGYLGVNLSDGSRQKVRKIHQLVAAAFLGPRPDGLIPLHWDGDSHNNRSSNLRYGTHKENTADAIRHGTFVLGERRTQATITAADAGAIKALLGSTSMGQLGRAFGISRAAVTQIRDEVTWRDATAANLQDAQQELKRRLAGTGKSLL